MFNVRSPHKLVSRIYVVELLKKFRKSGSIDNQKRDLKLEFPLRSEHVEVALFGQFHANPTLSTNKLASVTSYQYVLYPPNPEIA